MADGAEVPDTRAGKRFYVRRYRATIILLGLFVLMIACALLAYPQRSAVYRPSPLTVNLSVNGGTPGSASIDVAPFGPGFYTIVIELGVDAAAPGALGPILPPAPPPRPSSSASADTPAATASALVRNPPAGFIAVAEIDLPVGTTAEGCHYSRAITSGCTMYPSTTFPLVTEDVSNFDYSAHGSHPGVDYQGNGVWDIDFQFTIKASELAWEANGVSLEAQLPVVTVSQDKVLNSGQPDERAVTVPAPGNTNILITYGVPNAGAYDWTGGQSPYSVTLASALPSNGEATWDERLDTLSEPTPLSGTDNSEASLDATRTFVAGALVGIGGGAFVGAIQEAIPRQESEPSSGSGSSPGSPAPAPGELAQVDMDRAEEDTKPG